MKRTFKVVVRDNDGKFSLVRVKGERIVMGDLQCFVFEQQGVFNVSHLQTSINLYCDVNKNKAIRKSFEFYMLYPSVINRAIVHLVEHKIKYPVNK